MLVLNGTFFTKGESKPFGKALKYNRKYKIAFEVDF